MSITADYHHSLSQQPRWRGLDFASTPSETNSIFEGQGVAIPTLPSNQTLAELAQLQDNWDGRGSLRPSIKSISNARNLLQLVERKFRDSDSFIFVNPFISAGAEGEVVFEWWRGVRKLTLYVYDEDIEYLKSWGPHMLNDMDDGVLDGNIEELWLWLGV